MEYWEALVLAVIEGLTEFLPVSSTGHMIITSSFLGIAKHEFTKLFIIAIQLGTILSVVVLYYKRFFQSIEFYKKLLVAFLPALVLGFLFNDFIDALLESPVTVAISLIIGGAVLIKVDQWFGQGSSETEVNYKTAFLIGLFQCLAMIPGVSRSGASIVGGMTRKLSRTAAAEFSFFLAVPTMFGATVKKSFDYYQTGFPLTQEHINLLIIGNVVGFLVALVAIKSFINYLGQSGFKIFGYYRVGIGILLLILHLFINPLGLL